MSGGSGSGWLVSLIQATSMMHVCCCPQTYDKGGWVLTQLGPCFPAAALWQHLGRTPSLPWRLGLRVEVDGVLGERRKAVMKEGVCQSRYIKCAAAFRPLMGKQCVAWRFLPPDTLVFAVKTPAGRSAAAAEGGQEAGCSTAAAPAVTAATELLLRVWKRQREKKMQRRTRRRRGMGKEEEDEEGVEEAGAMAQLPAPPWPPQADQVTIQVTVGKAA